MNKRMLWSRILCGILCVAGVAMTALGLELDGRSIYVRCLLSGIGLVALSAFVGNTWHRTLVYGALALGVVSVAVRIAYWAGQARHGYVQPGVFVELGPWATLTGASVVLLESLRASTPALGGVSITPRRWWSRMVSFIGLAVMVWALEGTVAGGWRDILDHTHPGSESGLAALGVYLARSRCRALLYVVSSLLLPLVKEWWVGEGPSLAFIVQGLFMFAGSGLAALGAYLAKSHHRRFLYVALALTACGLTMLFLMARFNPPGNATEWWEIFYVTYPIGAILSLVGAVLVIIESFRRPPVPQDNVERNATYPSS